MFLFDAPIVLLGLALAGLALAVGTVASAMGRLRLLRAALERERAARDAATQAELALVEQRHRAEALAAALQACERRLSAAEARQTTFIAGASHEIRTPLNAVIGMAGLLLDTPLTPEQRVFADTIVTGGQALLEVINNILDFSRLEAGKLALELEPLALHGFLEDTVALVAQPAREKGVALRVVIAPDMPEVVLGDVGRLRQVLLNLLANAVKFTDAGEVALLARAAQLSGGRVQLELAVRDTGVGIDQSQLARIFEPFVQADSATARRYGGTGLGLAICRRLVVLMGGRIDVVSAPGDGSTFTARIPSLIARGARLPPVEKPALGQPLAVLIVEDNPINQEVTRHMVQHLGHHAVVVADGHAAVAAVQQGCYDLVLMDVQLPELDGVAATARIRALGARIVQPYIVGLTAEALEGDRERVLAAGMDAYLSKPVALPCLQRTLAQARPLARRALARGEAPAEPSLDAAALSAMMRPLNRPPAEGAAWVAQLFTQVLPPQLDALEAAIRRDDRAAWQAVGHKLSGGCMQVGARAMARLCRALEHEKTAGGAQALAVELRAAFAEACEQLSRLAETT